MTMMTIIWDERAREEFRQVVAYIRDHNPSAAARIRRAIQTSVARLREQPQMGRPGRSGNYRELVITGTSYIVVYVIDESRSLVIIVSILHGARQWPEEFPV